jgi:hypothetical protein
MLGHLCRLGAAARFGIRCKPVAKPVGDSSSTSAACGANLTTEAAMTQLVPDKVLVPRPVASSLAELLDGATVREPMDKTLDSLSGASFERVERDGQRLVLKHLHVHDDWVARATGDLVPRAMLVWRSGLLDVLPPCIDPAYVGVAAGLGAGGFGAAVLLRDVSDDLVPEGADPLEPEVHAQLVEDMATLHAHLWGWTDTIGLLPLANRVFELSPLTGDIEAELGSSDVVPPLIRPGWERLRRSGRAGELAWELLEDASPLLRGLESGPSTFVHGDWKAGNLATSASTAASTQSTDHRTVLLDWAVPGQAPGPVDLAWYLAVNCDRLPESKEATIERYRAALDAAGIDTEPWWDAQLALALILGFMQLGWSKDGDELAWWADRVESAEHVLGT